jgi:hypothetical protein
MKDVVKEVMNSVPQYLVNFYKHFGSPRQFTLDKLPKDVSGQKEALTEALKFMLISYVLIVIMAAKRLSTQENLYESLAVEGVTILVQVSLFVLTIYIPWRWFGSKRPFVDYLIIYSYNYGIIFVLMMLFIFLSDGYVKTNDPEGFRAVLDPKTSADAFNRPHVLAGYGIMFLGFLFVIVWAWIAWGAYRRMNNASWGRSFAVTVVASIFSIFVLYLSIMLQNGLTK